ncbi:MAG TPA: ABC transporter ATP-binding protein [Holophagaceae bacterium]|nr:ABC transporter ATP-binding protein [Holophagaceae bacterium]
MQSLLRFYRNHLRPYLPGALGGALLISLASLSDALLLSLLRLMFDQNLGMGAAQGPAAVQGLMSRILAHLPSPEALRRSLLFIPILIVTTFILRSALNYLGNVSVARSGLRAIRDMRTRIFDHLLTLDPAFFQKHPVGELMNRVLGDVGMIQQLASSQIAEVLRQTTTAVVMTAYIISINWRFALILLVALPLVAGPVRWIGKAIRRIAHRSLRSADGLLQRLKEVLANMRVVKAFAREDYESARFREKNQELYRLSMKVVRTQSLSSPVMEIVGGFLLASLVTYGALLVRDHRATGGAFIVFLLAVYALYAPIRILTRIYADLQNGTVALERIFGLLDQRPALGAPAEPLPVPERPSSLAFEGVRFTYDDKHQVLRGIDLQVRRGETVALVGSSGGGKTTMANLVPRFFDPTEGRLTLDGTDLRAFDPRELRQRIGVVTQETLLFMDTVHDNIAYGKPASREAVIEAAKRAHAHDFIAALPKGYDTPLAETGSTLSGGQRQRIAIARALLQDPPILVLDEATSALDTESERAVQAALEELMKDRTTIVIAHRLSTVQKATRICALKHGQIVEQGTHDELLALGGEYARLHALQFREA